MSPGPALPDLPAWAAHVIAGGLALALVATLLLFLVSFPPQGASGSSPPRDGANAPNEYEAPPTLTRRAWHQGLRQRARIQDLSVDTRAYYGGLGIAVPGVDDGPHQAPPSSPPVLTPARKSGDTPPPTTPSSSRRGFRHPRRSPTPLDPRGRRAGRRGPASPPPTAARSLPSTPRDRARGVPPPLPLHTRTPSSRARRPPPPRPRSASSPPPRVRRALDTLGHGIERGADRLARFTHDPVTHGHWERGLLLPVTAQERVRERSPPPGVAP